MPFPKKAEPATRIVGQHGYVKDPELAQQYRAYIDDILPSGELNLVLWMGNPPVMPQNNDTKMEVILPNDAFFSTPIAGLPVMGYGEGVGRDLTPPAAVTTPVITMNTPAVGTTSPQLATRTPPVANPTPRADAVLATAKDAPVQNNPTFSDVCVLDIEGVTGVTRIGRVEDRNGKPWGDVMTFDGLSTGIFVPLKDGTRLNAELNKPVFDQLFETIKFWHQQVQKQALPAELEPKKGRGRPAKAKAVVPDAVPLTTGAGAAPPDRASDDEFERRVLDIVDKRIQDAFERAAAFLHQENQR